MESNAGTLGIVAMRMDLTSLLVSLEDGENEGALVGGLDMIRKISRKECNFCAVSFFRLRGFLRWIL